jgi:hypothetical protein
MEKADLVVDKNHLAGSSRRVSVFHSQHHSTSASDSFTYCFDSF